jgi:hypothetical protein
MTTLSRTPSNSIAAALQFATVDAETFVSVMWLIE